MSYLLRCFAIILIFRIAAHVPVAAAQNIWEATPWRYYTNQIVVDSRGVIFAGTYGKGIISSSDNGNTWVSANNGIPSQDSISFHLTITPRGDLLATVTENGYFYGHLPVYRSSDHGNSWVPSSTGLPTACDGEFARAPNGTIIMAENINGIHRSTDDGRTWAVADTGLPRNTSGGPYSVFTECPAIDSNGNMFVLGVPGLYFSSDNGNTWISRVSTTPHVLAFLAVGPHNALYGGTALDQRSLDTTTQYTLQRSTDLGLTWVKIDSFYNLPNSEVASMVFSGDNEIIFGLALTLNGSLSFMSTDDGISWEDISSGMKAVNGDLGILSVNGFALRKDGILFAAGYGGIRRTKSSVLGVKDEPSRSGLASGNSEISFTLSEPSFATIRIYDAAGREVKSIRQNWDAGKHSISAQSLFLRSGVYFYSISSASINQTGKLLLFAGS